MVRRIRFIYRKSLSKFGNDPVHLWKALECSRTFRKKLPWKVESRKDSTNPNQPTKWEGGVHGGLHLLGRPSKGGRGESLSLQVSSIRQFLNWGLIRRLWANPWGSTYIMRERGRGPATTPAAPPKGTKAGAPSAPSLQTLATPSSRYSRGAQAKPCRRSPPPPPPRRRAVGIPRRIYYFRCPLERGEGRRHQHRTCDRVRRCCPIVAPSRSSTCFCKRQVIDYIHPEI